MLVKCLNLVSSWGQRSDRFLSFFGSKMLSEYCSSLISFSMSSSRKTLSVSQSLNFVSCLSESFPKLSRHRTRYPNPKNPSQGKWNSLRAERRNRGRTWAQLRSKTNYNMRSLFIYLLFIFLFADQYWCYCVHCSTGNKDQADSSHILS